MLGDLVGCRVRIFGVNSKVGLPTLHSMTTSIASLDRDWMTSERTSGLLNTSASIAREFMRELGEIPERVSVSVTMIGELELGVASAHD